MKFWEVRMAAERVGELLLYGTIMSESFWGDEITPKQIDADLKALGELDTLNVRINSPGGSVFAGQAIYSIIKRHPAAAKNAYIDGLAASMATIIPNACDKVYMPTNALMMIHRPYAGYVGNADELRQKADVLDKMESQVIDIYAEKSGLDADKIKELLAAETWMTAQEALDYGFIDEIEKDFRVAASLDGDFLVYGDVRTDVKAFKNFNPELYREALTPPEPVAKIDPEPGPDPTDPPDLTAQSQEFNRLRSKIYKYEEDV